MKSLSEPYISEKYRNEKQSPAETKRLKSLCKKHKKQPFDKSKLVILPKRNIPESNEECLDKLRVNSYGQMFVNGVYIGGIFDNKVTCYPGTKNHQHLKIADCDLFRTGFMVYGYGMIDKKDLLAIDYWENDEYGVYHISMVDYLNKYFEYYREKTQQFNKDASYNKPSVLPKVFRKVKMLEWFDSLEFGNISCPKHKDTDKVYLIKLNEKYCYSTGVLIPLKDGLMISSDISTLDDNKFRSIPSNLCNVDYNKSFAIEIKNGIDYIGVSNGKAGSFKKVDDKLVNVKHVKRFSNMELIPEAESNWAIDISYLKPIVKSGNTIEVVRGIGERGLGVLVISGEKYLMAPIVLKNLK